MLSIRLITAGGEDYYLNLAAEDYYVAGGEPPGVWSGSGAKALGLSGPVKPDVFRRVFRGYHPTRDIGLVQNAGYSDRQCAWDFTFSAPKSVSIVWSLVSFAVRLLIQKFQQMAVEATLRYAEQHLVFSRAGKGGATSHSVGLVVSLWEHGTNRLLQPQLHTHAVLMNLGVAANGKVRAIYSKRLFRYKKVLGAYYRAYLAHLLETELGLSLVRKGDSFEIDGIPEDLIKVHSKRRAQILKYLKNNHLEGPVAAAEAALKTRRTKKDIPPREKLFERWQAENRARRFTEASVASLPRAASRDLAQDLPRALASAKDRMARRCSHFSMKDFLFETLLEAPKWGIPPEGVPQAVADYLASDQGIVRLRPMDGETRYTTKAILKQESRLLRLLIRLRRDAGPRADYHRVQKTLARFPRLRPEQARAVQYLTRGRGRLRVLCGKAGTGKTTTLCVACRIWRKQGYRVIGLTPTGNAASVLQQATDIDTQTIHRRMGDYKISPKRVIRHHLKQFFRALQGKRTYGLKRPKPIKIDARTIVVIDEAGMVNSRHMRMVMNHVRKGGGTLVLAGDPSQLSPIEGPAPFHSIARRAGFVELTQISRQKEEWAREAVELFAQGKPAEALRLYADHRLVTVREDRDEALRALVLDWTAVGLTSPEQAAVLVATNHESETTNHLCQAKRLEAGCLNPHHWVEIRDEDEAKGLTYVNRVHVGDRILFTRNSLRYHVENGAVGTVIALNSSLFRKSLAVKLDNGRRVVVPVKDFPHMRLGYAMTTHKAQGVTVPEVCALVGGPMQDQPISYVQASRAIRDTHFYTEKALLDQYLEEIQDSPLAKQMAQSPELSLASDLLPDVCVDEAPGSPVPAPTPAPGKASSTPARRKRRRRRRPPKPAHHDNRDLTYGMAQMEALERRRRLRRARLFPGEIPEDLPLADPTRASEVPQQSTLAMQYFATAPDDSTLDLDTSTNVPIHVIVDAHFVDTALQAEVASCEEEAERERREYLERLCREQEAAAQQRAQLQPAQQASWEPMACFSATSVSSSSSTSYFPQFSTDVVAGAPSATPAYDHQAYVMAGGAATEWAKRYETDYTTRLMPAS